MNLKIFTTLFLFLLFLSDGDPVSWRSSHKLTWEDFKGNAKLETGAVAVTASGITFSYSLKRNGNKIIGFDVLVEAHFYPENSWYLKNKANDYILAHEQLHFDITELHTRIFRYRISQLKVSQDIKVKLNELYISSQRELYEMQNLYDQQSDNSIDKIYQYKWEQYVNMELRKYERYASR